MGGLLVAETDLLLEKHVVGFADLCITTRSVLEGVADEVPLRSVHLRIAHDGVDAGALDDITADGVKLNRLFGHCTCDPLCFSNLGKNTIYIFYNI